MNDFQMNMPDQFLEDADQLKQQRLAEQELDAMEQQQAQQAEQT